VEKQRGVYFVRFLIASKIDNFTWNLVVVYGDAQQDGKANFLVELVNVIRSSTHPILIIGDFNMTRKGSEKNKPGGYNRWSPLFNVATEQGGLTEIALSGRKFTWCNNHEDPTYELLDRVLVSPSWEEKFPLVCATTLPGELSDLTYPHFNQDRGHAQDPGYFQI
jgi:endonuclease/exonuclease/phosphatase family metal-dependent hydrolase